MRTRPTILGPTIASMITGFLLLSARAADFDYYVLAVSWTPGYCNSTKAQGRTSQFCKENQKPRFIVHGLWPQNEKGWPQFCDAAAPDDTIFYKMRDLLSSPSAARHQWKRHGTCSGLSGAAYFSALRQAYNGFAKPDLAHLNQISQAELRVKLVKANPGLDEAFYALRCRQDSLREIRVCLTKSLEPRACGLDVRSTCTKPVILLH